MKGSSGETVGPVVRCVRSNETTSSSLSSSLDLFEAEVDFGPLLRTVDDDTHSFWRR
jgi:hypothetical protein